MLTLRTGLALVLFTALAGAQEHVSLPTKDGVLIDADLYGQGRRAVVLAHGGRFRKESWQQQASVLVAAGFRVMAIDYRGEGQPVSGTSDAALEAGRPLDVLGAVHYLRSKGAQSAFVVGASMGGDYSAQAAELEPPAIDRLVLLGSGAYTPLVRMQGRKLFLVSVDDANAEGPRLPAIRAQYDKAGKPKQLIVVAGSAHAQFLFQTEQGPRVMREILHFLSAP